MLVCLVWIVVSALWMPFCSASTSEEQRWDQYFGPVTEDEKQLYPDDKWKDVRREWIDGSSRSERKEIKEKQKRDADWYLHNVRLALAELAKPIEERYGPPFDGAPRLDQSGVIERISHDEATAELLRNILHAYQNLDQFHGRATVWRTYVRSNTDFTNESINEFEYWFRRDVGMRLHRKYYGPNSELTEEFWPKDQCIHSYSRYGVHDQVMGIDYKDQCVLPFYRELESKVLGEWNSLMWPAAPQLLFGGGWLSRFLGGTKCRKVMNPVLMLHCTADTKIDESATQRYIDMVWMIDPASHRIIAQRYASQGSIIVVRYEPGLDSKGVSAQDMVFSPEEDIDALIAAEQGRVLGDRKELLGAERKLRIAGKLCLGNSSDKRISNLRAAYTMICGAAISNPLGNKRRYRDMLRRCDPQIWNARVDGYQKGEIDGKTGKSWDELEEICRKKFTPPALFELPWLFPICPDWAKTCEEQWQ